MQKGICSKNPRFCCVAEANCCRCLFYLRVMGRAMDSSTRLGGYKKALCTAFVQQSLKEVLECFQQPGQLRQVIDDMGTGFFQPGAGLMPAGV